MAAEIAVVGAGVEFGLRHGALDLGDLLGTLVHEQDDKLHLGVVLYHGIRDVLQQGSLAGAGRRDNESALPLANGGHEIDNAGGEALGDRFELDPLIRADGGQLLEERNVHVLRGILSLDLRSAEELESTGPTARLTLDQNAIS